MVIIEILIKIHPFTTCVKTHYILCVLINLESFIGILHF